jgi:hypothetical protein
MLSLACSADGQTVLAGSYSNIWISQDAGASWNQATWPQPAANQFGVPGSLGGWCVLDIAIFEGWRVDRHPRQLGVLTSSGRQDIVGFGDGGVWTALSAGDGSFQAPGNVIVNFGYNAGGWQVDQHPRFLADLSGNGRADIIGFGEAGVWTALSNGDGTFQEPKFVLADFGINAGGWQVDQHPRLLADLTGNGRADIVGFGDAGVWTALSNGDGTFQAPKFVLADFGINAGGWQVDKHPRLLADLTGNGRADIVGFGDAGVWTALSNGDGTFQAPKFVLADFGINAGGWQVDQHPRLLADLTGNGRADIIGFGDAGVWTALSNGDGTFQAPNFVLAAFGVNAGDWEVDKNPRFLADLTGDGRADIIGFGDAGVWTALSNGDGSFQPARFVIADFGYQAGGWQVDKHPRFPADLSGNGRADIVGFGDAGVWTALSNGDGTFQNPQFVLAQFGCLLSALALTRFDRESMDAGIWRSSDAGANWTQVYNYQRNVTDQDPQPPPPAAGQLAKAPGNDHLMYAACGNALAVSRDAGSTFTNVAVTGATSSDQFFHVAIGQPSADPNLPTSIYTLANGVMFVSLDGGSIWTRDLGNISLLAGAAVSTFVSTAPACMVVSPQSNLELFVVVNDQANFNNQDLFHADYTQFSSTQASVWTPMIAPPPANQFPQRPFEDSGCVCIAVTAPGQGDLIFFNPMRTNAYVGPLNPKSARDWIPLDQGPGLGILGPGNVHVDLHGIILSPDFSASLSAGIDGGNYRLKTGTVWLLSDGGIYKSTDGGIHFQQASNNVHTLASVCVAGVAISGKGTALSINHGDNDGFFSLDDGAHWASQDYGGGDNDCAYADPLRPHSMLVYTPRSFGSDNRTTKLAVYETSPGNLPDARMGTNQAHYIPGPPAGSKLNCTSGFGIRGSRPMILNSPADNPANPGDYVFVLLTTSGSGATRSLVVRTQKMLQIGNGADWLTNTTDPSALVFQQGPDLPHTDLEILQASGGHASPVFYAGGNGANELWKWTSGMANWTRIVPASNANAALRFFVSPYDPSVIYLLDAANIRRSDDGGNSWQTDINLEKQLSANYRVPIARAPQSDLNDKPIEAALVDMAFDAGNPNIRFAIGQAGAFTTRDGVCWTRLLDTGALPCRPMNCYYDSIGTPGGALYVSMSVRGLIKISPLVALTLVTVPSVVNSLVALAVSQIKAAHLVPSFSSLHQSGSWVSSQSPVAGEQVPPGTTVTLTLHTGPIP